MSEWKAMPLYGIAKPKQIINCVDRELLSVYLGKGVVPFSSQAAKRTNVTSTDLTKYQAVDCGDFVLNNQQAWRGSVGVSKYSGIVSPAYIVLSLSDAISTDYANYLFQSRGMIDKYVVCSKGVGSIQRNIYWDYLKRVKFLLPPREEQDQIVRFLNWKVSQVNRLINSKKKQIGLLQEQKRAVINAAVTKGLNPDVAMKDSGLFWLCEIPVNWSIVPLKRFANNITSGSRGWAEYYSDEGAVFIRIGNLTRDSLNLKTKDIVRVAPPEGSEGERTRVVAQDVLFSITAYLGSVAVVPSDFELAYVNQHVCLARLSEEKIDAKWIGYCALSYHGQYYLNYQSYGGTKVQLALSDIAEFPVILCPLTEQKQIVEHIEKCCSKIDRCISVTENLITLLYEYRTRLISDVVTGKQDVHDMVVPNYEVVVVTAENEPSEDEDIAEGDDK